MNAHRRLPRIVLAADHGGVALKADLREFLLEKGYPVRDLGTEGEQPVDYPDYGIAASLMIHRREADRAVLLCKTGNGMAICANKTAGVRAALAATEEDADLARRHNDANVLVLHATSLPRARARRIVAAWLSAPFDGGRHARRVNKIRRFEKAHWKEE